MPGRSWPISARPSSTPARAEGQSKNNGKASDNREVAATLIRCRNCLEKGGKSLRARRRIEAGTRGRMMEGGANRAVARQAYAEADAQIGPERKAEVDRRLAGRTRTVYRVAKV